jgi:diguanylate cyclase (GGDEF)-like protein
VGVGATLPSIAEGIFLLGVEPVPVASALATALVAHVLIGDQPTGAEPVARSAVVEEMEDAVVVLGRDGSIVDLNRSARERLGLEIRGPLPLEIGMAWCSSVEALRSGGVRPTTRVELELVYGTEATFELTMTPLGPRAGRNRTVLVLRDITEREQMEQELRRATESLRFLANTDSLTDLANRRHFEERLHEEVERAHRYERPLSLILLDLDHFKTVNDTWGHPAGDRVLRATAGVLKSVLREMDLAGRLGGEELAVLLPETDEEGAQALADRLRREIKEVEHRSDDDRPFHVTASVGIAWLAEGAQHDAEALFSTADQALYEAKGGGRDRVVTKAIGSRVDLSA